VALSWLMAVRAAGMSNVAVAICLTAGLFAVGGGGHFFRTAGVCDNSAFCGLSVACFYSMLAPGVRLLASFGYVDNESYACAVHNVTAVYYREQAHNDYERECVDKMSECLCERVPCIICI
jgi:hypothetical protein